MAQSSCLLLLNKIVLHHHRKESRFHAVNVDEGHRQERGLIHPSKHCSAKIVPAVTHSLPALRQRLNRCSPVPKAAQQITVTLKRVINSTIHILVGSSKFDLNTLMSKVWVTDWQIKKIICGGYFLVKPKQTYPTLPRLNIAVHTNMTNLQKKCHFWYARHAEVINK